MKQRGDIQLLTPPPTGSEECVTATRAFEVATHLQRRLALPGPLNGGGREENTVAAPLGGSCGFGWPWAARPGPGSAADSTGPSPVQDREGKKKKKAHLETASARVCPGPAKEEGHVWKKKSWIILTDHPGMGTKASCQRNNLRRALEKCSCCWWLPSRCQCNAGYCHTGALGERCSAGPSRHHVLPVFSHSQEASHSSTPTLSYRLRHWEISHRGPFCTRLQWQLTFCSASLSELGGSGLVSRLGAAIPASAILLFKARLRQTEGWYGACKSFQDKAERWRLKAI